MLLGIQVFEAEDARMNAAITSIEGASEHWAVVYLTDYDILADRKFAAPMIRVTDGLIASECEAVARIARALLEGGSCAPFLVVRVRPDMAMFKPERDPATGSIALRPLIAG